MIDRQHDLPITKQAEVLRISRGSVYFLPRPVPAADLAIMRRLDRLHLEFPFAGSRMLRGLLAAEGCKIGRRHVKTLMRRMGIEALYRRPRTTKPEPGHKIYPYLLRGVEITQPNQVWAMDITYIPMERGFVYLAVVLDWFIRQSDGHRSASKNSNARSGRPYFHVSDFNRLRCVASAMPERELDGFAHTDPFDLLGEVRQATNRLPVCGHDDVAQLSGRGVEPAQARARGRRARYRTHNDHTFDAKPGRDGFAACDDADARRRHPAIADELRDNPVHDVDRDGKADPGVRA
jgi:hypothetical protein